MFKFKIGQRVRISHYNNNPFEGTAIIIDKSKSPFGNLYTLQHEQEHWKRYYGEKLITAADDICPVCEKQIEIEDNKVKPHQHNNELCYGSYTPMGL